MELALSLGDAAPKPFAFLSKTPKLANDFGFFMGLDSGFSNGVEEKSDSHHGCDVEVTKRTGLTSDPPVQLDLLPFAPVHRTQSSLQFRFPWLSDNLMSERVSADGPGRVLDVNRLPSVAAAADDGEDRAALSSPNSTVSSFQMDFCAGNGGGRSKRDFEAETERTSSRASDDEENGSTRKKLRLSKEQSAYLEESFKEHSTLNPKQKQALAKQLNLRPRQVEVWFQNRRARTKLKQTEVDCEYLKRCCETLTEENRRLQKELQELRALKSTHPFYMHLPATTLTMCPSCERVATTSTTTSTASPATTTTKPAATTVNSTTLCLAKPGMFPFSHNSQSHLHQTAS